MEEMRPKCCLIDTKVQLCFLIYNMSIMEIYQRKPIHCLITRVWKQEKRRPKAELRRQKVINNTVSRSLLCPGSSVKLGRLSTTLWGWPRTRWSGKLRLGHRFWYEMFRHSILKVKRAERSKESILHNCRTHSYALWFLVLTLTDAARDIEEEAVSTFWKE